MWAWPMLCISEDAGLLVNLIEDRSVGNYAATKPTVQLNRAKDVPY
jgi:hypothetical protein